MARKRVSFRTSKACGFEASLHQLVLKQKFPRLSASSDGAGWDRKKAPEEVLCKVPSWQGFIRWPSKPVSILQSHALAISLQNVVHTNTPLNFVFAWHLDEKNISHSNSGMHGEAWTITCMPELDSFQFTACRYRSEGHLSTSRMCGLNARLLCPLQGQGLRCPKLIFYSVAAGGSGCDNSFYIIVSGSG